MELQSNEVDKIAAALVKVQKALTPAVKSAENPFYTEKRGHKVAYADLESNWDACRAPLQENGIAVVQGGVLIDGVSHLITTLLHISGQWIRGAFALTPVKDDPQAVGSAISYMRRYSLASMVGVVTADDDGEAAMTRNGAKKRQSKTGPGSKKWDDLAKEIGAVADKVEPGRRESVEVMWMEKADLTRKVDASVRQLETLLITMTSEFNAQVERETA